MAKTIVVAAHSLGPFQNGVDGCHGRWAEGGLCPGGKIAAWLNALGEDDELYIKGNPAVAGARDITNGEVRTNWLNGNSHIRALEPERANLIAQKNRLSADLRRVNKRLRYLEKTPVS